MESAPPVAAPLAAVPLAAAPLAALHAPPPAAPDLFAAGLCDFIFIISMFGLYEFAAVLFPAVVSPCGVVTSDWFGVRSSSPLASDSAFYWPSET